MYVRLAASSFWKMLEVIRAPGVICVPFAGTHMRGKVFRHVTSLSLEDLQLAMLGCLLLVVGVLLSDLASGKQQVLNSYETEHGILRRFTNKTVVPQILAVAEVSISKLGSTLHR